jgi:hypothetical protein
MFATMDKANPDTGITKDLNLAAAVVTGATNDRS